MIAAEALKKSYRTGDETVFAVKDATISVDRGEMIAVILIIAKLFCLLKYPRSILLVSQPHRRTFNL